MLHATNYSSCFRNAGPVLHRLTDQPKGPINPENPITDLMSSEIKGHRKELPLYRRKGNAECPHFEWITVFAPGATGNLLET